MMSDETEDPPFKKHVIISKIGVLKLHCHLSPDAEITSSVTLFYHIRVFDLFSSLLQPAVLVQY